MSNKLKKNLCRFCPKQPNRTKTVRACGRLFAALTQNGSKFNLEKRRRTEKFRTALTAHGKRTQKGGVHAPPRN
jgi:hypothetical protein